MTPNYSYTHTISRDTIRAAQERIKSNFIKYGICDDRRQDAYFERLAASAEVDKLRWDIRERSITCQALPWSFDGDGNVEVLCVFARETDLIAFEAAFCPDEHPHC